MTLCPNCKINQTDAATALCERCGELASKDREIEKLREVDASLTAEIDRLRRALSDAKERAISELDYVGACQVRDALAGEKAPA